MSLNISWHKFNDFHYKRTKLSSTETEF